MNVRKDIDSEILKKLYLEGNSSNEIAKIFNIPASTVLYRFKKINFNFRNTTELLRKNTKKLWQTPEYRLKQKLNNKGNKGKHWKVKDTTNIRLANTGKHWKVKDTTNLKGKKNYPIWSKGLTKYTDERLKKAGENISKGIKIAYQTKKFWFEKGNTKYSRKKKDSGYQMKDGRWMITINGKHVIRYRYIAEQCLKRKLIKGELIHHINENSLDDRPENLYLFKTKKEHLDYHRFKKDYIKETNLFENNI